MTNRGYLLKSNLSEKQIEADVAGFFGWCTPPDAVAPFRLLDLNEQTTGADKLFDVATLIYLQFKKSQGLKPITKTKSRARNPLNNIRQFRRRNELECDPSLFFQLRKKSKTSIDFQHNVLLAHERPPSSRGIYVAPLILDKNAYAATLFDSMSRYLDYPFYTQLGYVVHAERWTSHFGSVPFLREHVSIPPHERVNSHHHFFAYSEAGVDISWHSPEVISLEPARLSDFIMSLFSNALTNSDAMISLELASTIAIEAGMSFGFSEDFRSTPDATALDRLQVYGKWLRTEYDIRQMILLGTSERLGEFRT